MIGERKPSTAEGFGRPGEVNFLWMYFGDGKTARPSGGQRDFMACAARHGSGLFNAPLKPLLNALFYPVITRP
jgi:hypothetical protein